MKKLSLILSILLITSYNVFPQGGDFSLYTVGAKFLLDKTKIDPIIIQIVERTLPKAMNQDAEGAVSEFASVIYEKKNIKELNPAFAKYTTNKIIHLTKVFPQKDYFEITMSIADLILVTDNFLNHNIVPDNTNLNTNKAAYAVVDTNAINKSIEAVSIDHKTIIEQLKKVNEENKKIRCIAFTSFGGYAILYGNNGYITKGIPIEAKTKLKELNDAEKTIKNIAFSPTGGYVILYGKSGFSARAVSQKLIDNLNILNSNGSSIESVSFSPTGGYVIIYDKYGFTSSQISTKLNDQLKQLNESKKDIKNVAFEEDGGYVVNFGKNGWASSQVPKTTNEKLNELNESSKNIDFVSFITGGGHVIIYDNSGYTYRGRK